MSLDRLATVLDKTAVPAGPIDIAELPLVDVIDEMIERLSETRPIDHHRAYALQSAYTDLTASYEMGRGGLPPNARHDLDGFDLEAAIAEHKGAGPLVHLGALLRARRALASSRAPGLAWQAMAGCFDASPGELAWHRENLERIASVNGFETSWTLQRMGSILVDGERDSTPVERIRSAGELLSDAVGEGDHVVWLAVERAVMHRMSLELGSVTLYDGRWIGGVLDEQDSPNRRGLPAEIQQCTSSPFPEGSEIVVARVALGSSKGPLAVRDARHHLTLLLAPADRREFGDWSLMLGHLVYRDGYETAQYMFSKRHEDLRMNLDSPPHWLEAGAADLSMALSSQPEPELIRLLELVAWDAEHRSEDPLATILLAIRTLETISQSHLNGTKWTDFAEKYARRVAINSLRRNLVLECHRALHRPRYEVTAEAQADARELALQCFSSTTAGFSTDLSRLAAHLPQIATFWVDRPDRHEDLIALGELWSSPSVFMSRLLEFENVVRRKIDRSRRLRNAAQHGGPISDALLRSVQPFVNELRGLVLVDLVHGLTNNETSMSVYEKCQDLGDRRWASLESGNPPIDAILIA